MTDEQQAAVQPRHLGDGVYVSFDGYQLWLAANSHDSPQRVALEPGVLGMLIDYAAGINKAHGTPYFPVPVKRQDEDE